MSWQATAARLAAAAFRALGNEVEIDGVSGWGILQSPSESVFDGVVVITDYMLELDRAVWPVVPEGSVVTVDGVIYTAREQSRINRDGSSVMVPLEPTGRQVLAPPFPGQTTIIDGDWDETMGAVDVIDGDWDGN
jgi:hypothetical protein